MSPKYIHTKVRCPVCGAVTEVVELAHSVEECDIVCRLCGAHLEVKDGKVLAAVATPQEAWHGTSPRL